MRKVIPKGAILVPPEAKRVFKGVFYDTYHWPQKLFDGSTATFEMLKRPDTVKVIAVKDDKIVMTEQEQPGRSVFYDIPGGIHDHEEDEELQAAQRELLEETGMTFKDWKLISAYQPHNKIEHFVYIFLATDFVDEVPQQLDAGEKIKVRLLTLDEVQDLFRAGKGRYFPKQIEEAESLEDILNLPEYSVK